MKIYKFAVVGHPILHTMSPFIHEYLFNLSGENPIYDILDIEDVEKSKDILEKYDGLNITIPHKTNIIKLLSKIDSKASRFGSVNTVKMENGQLEGFTTDGIGAVLALENQFVKVEGAKILILGNGGAARALAFEFSDNDAKIFIAARNFEKAQKLCSEIPNSIAKTIAEVEVENEQYDILVNATSLGMYPKTGISPVSKNMLSKVSTVFDIVYNPQDTELIKLAKENGNKVVYGMDMLVLQAVAAHKHWYNAKFKREDIEKLITLAKKECIRLFGNKQ